MHTPTHAVVTLAGLDRGRYAGCWLALCVGAVLPDLPSIAVSSWFLGVQGVPSEVLYGGLYQERWFALALAPFHALPVGALILGVSIWRRWRSVEAFALAFLLHSLFDLPLHGADAHAHLFPFTDLRVHSPLSYWDRAAHAEVVAGLEVLGCIAATASVWRRYKNAISRAALVLATVGMAVAYLSGALFWGT